MKVWIEVDRPKNDAEGLEACEKLNNMMARLNNGDTQGWLFHWSHNDRRLCWGNAMGYEVLPDNGNWFNLDHLGRPLTK